ncbi:alpha/beta hydrolase [Pseudonocardiaceae bacterium YIM PH 21723]|nr:alpha/beta hydrolase [Pseudonocardiaceae bacterium YIM PH 21723]
MNLHHFRRHPAALIVMLVDMELLAIAGTPVVAEAYGDGSPAVIVHGVQSVAAHWAPIAEALPGRTIVPNRRGRSLSGPHGDGYTLATEVADLHAALDQAGPGTLLIGHSYGGLVALLTAAERSDLAGLVLYEPVFPLPGLTGLEGAKAVADRYRDGDLDGALVALQQELLGEQPEHIELFRKVDPRGWQVQLDMLEATLTEFRALGQIEVDTDSLSKITAPTTVLLGALSQDRPVIFGPAAETLVEHIPGAKLELLEGQGHIAHLLNPQLVLDAILAADRVPASE